MAEKVDLKLYTAAQLKDWLLHNKAAEGLSEVMIDKVRAYALVTNPYVNDDMSLVSALFVDGKVAAYTYVFPDRMEKPHGRTIFWNTTLYVNPNYEGRGYAYCVIAAICELYGDDYFDLDAAEASVENLKYQGLTVTYRPQYILRQKAMSSGSGKAALAQVWNKLCGYFRSREKELRAQIVNSDYRLQYVNYVDDETYAFVRSHAKDDLLLRSQESMNWILQHHFMIESPLRRRVRRRCKFASALPIFRMYAFVVRQQEQIVGFVVLRTTCNEWAVKYLYYDEMAREVVFMAVAEHLLAEQRPLFSTADKRLHDYVAQYRIYACEEIYNRSFSYPKNFDYDASLNIQAGDGDNVT